MRKLIILASAFVLSLSACTPRESANASPSDAAHNSQNALDWAGSYKGVLPCADCEGIERVVTLKADGSYESASRYLGKSKDIFRDSGRFVWDEKGRSISLEMKGDPTRYLVGENQLTMLDREGNAITGALAEKYRLAKQAEPALRETYWKLVELMGQPVTDLPRDAFFILKEKDQRVMGSGGCNSIGGSYETDNQFKLRFSQMMGTMMACMKGGDTEQKFLDVLTKVDSYTIQGGVLQLNRARMAPLAKFEPVYLY